MRIFLGLPLPADLRRDIAREYSPITSHPALRKVSALQYHITLHFLGDCPEEEVRSLITLLTLGRGAFTGGGTALEVREPLFFPGGSREPRTLVLRLSSGFAVVNSLYKASSLLLGREERRFTPHLTLARVKGRLQRAEAAALIREKQAEARSFSFPLREIVLYESLLSRKEARYIPLLHIPLQCR